jgi:hypothetical protein
MDCPSCAPMAGARIERPDASMSESLRSADRHTHLRIVAVALVAALGVVIVGIYARDSNPGTVTADVKVDRRVVKAGQPAAYTDRASSNLR